MTTNSTGERPDPLPPLSTEPYYRPTLIAAMAASLGVIVGTLGPWATIVVFTVNGLETSWWGITTLTLGALCGVVLLVVLFWT